VNTVVIKNSFLLFLYCDITLQQSGDRMTSMDFVNNTYEKMSDAALFHCHGFLNTIKSLHNAMS
jgi:hypothetical protein